MDTFPDPNFREATATISLKADSQDYEALRTHSKRAGLGQSNMLHLLMEMMRLRLTVERSKGNLAIDMFGSDLEAYIWLTAQDSGLINAENMQAQAWAVKNTWSGAPFKDRLNGTFELLQKQFAARFGSDVSDMLLMEFGAFEAVDDDHPAQTAATIKKLGEQQNSKAEPHAGAAE